MHDEQLRQVCEQLPLFPLPGAVLLPGALLPLHVFEPRYRDLVRHCLDGPPIMGIATLQPGFEEDYDGAPPIYDTLGVGELVAHQRLDDGRFYIVLRYVGRVRVEQELEVPHAFRVVRATLRPENAEGAETALGRLKLMLMQLGARTSDEDDPQRGIREGGLELADAVANELLQSSEERRAYLEQDRVVERIAMLETHLVGLLGQAVPTVGEA